MKRCPLCLKTYEELQVCPEDGATLLTASAARVSLIGEVLNGSYKIISHLGDGGCGSVYLAVQQPLGREVAVKVLRQQGVTTEVIQRFLKEARMLSNLQHPNVIGVIDFGNTEEGLSYLVMECVKGKTLKEYVPANHGLGGEEVIRLMTQICGGVQAAHRLNVVHRDLKPANIMVSGAAECTAKVLDFGISKDLSANSTIQTGTGIVMGTPGYLSPEQIRSTKGIDTRADIYALGAVLYFMIAGRAPFDGESPTEVLAKQLTELPQPIQTHEIRDQQAGALLPVIERAMRHDPAERYQTIDELAADLMNVGARAGYDTIAATSAIRNLGPASTGMVEKQRAVSHRGQQSHTIWMGGLAAVLLAMVALVVGVAGPQQPPAQARVEKRITNAPGATDRGVSSDSIIIGMTGAFSGSARELGRGVKTGIEAAFAVANAKNGVHGRKLKLVALDDGYDPIEALENTRRLIEDEQVFAFLGNVGTPTAEASLPAAIERKTIVFGSFTGSSLLRKIPPDRYVFNYRASYREETATLVRHLLEVRKIAPKDIVVFAQNDRFGEEGYLGVLAALEDSGVTLRANEAILRVGYERNRADVDEAVKRILAERRSVKAVICIATAAASARFTIKLRERGSKALVANVSFVGSRALQEEFRDLGPEYGENVIVSQVVPDVDSNATLVIRYREAIAKYFPNEKPGYTSLEGYVAASLFIEGLQRTGAQLTTERLADVFESMNSVDLGVGTKLQFGLSDHQASDRIWAIELDKVGGFRPIELAPHRL